MAGDLQEAGDADPKCELNITFLTLPHPLHSVISAKDIMTIVLLLQVTRGWEGWEVVHLCQGLGEGAERVSIIFFLFFFCFCAVVHCSFMAGT